jgi:hypothetical protein
MMDRDACLSRSQRVHFSPPARTSKGVFFCSFSEPEWGTNSSPEGLHKGFIHCWIIPFRTGVDRNACLKHPEHDAFVQIAKPILADVPVVDFAPNDT